MTRLLTGLAIAIVVIAAMFLPPVTFSLLAGLFTFALVWEWVKLCKSSRRAKIIFALLLPAALGTNWWWPQVQFWIYIPTVILNTLVWSVIIGLLITRPLAMGRSLWGRYGPEVGFVVLFAFWLTLVHLHRDHFWLLFTLLTSVALLDTFSLVGGKLYGTRKLAASLSPSKTWEGVICGALAAIIPIATLAFTDAMGWININSWYILVAALSTIAAPFGDLFESLLKRLHRVKDSGKLLPGHGGLLDRVDSYLAVVPFCAFFALVLS